MLLESWIRGFDIAGTAQAIEVDGEGRFLFVAAREKNGSRRIFRLPLAGTETVPTMAFSEDSLWILGDRHPATGSMQDGLMKRAWVIAGLLGLNSWDVGASLFDEDNDGLLDPPLFLDGLGFDAAFLQSGAWTNSTWL